MVSKLSFKANTPREHKSVKGLLWQTNLQEEARNKSPKLVLLPEDISGGGNLGFLVILYQLQDIPLPKSSPGLHLFPPCKTTTTTKTFGDFEKYPIYHLEKNSHINDGKSYTASVQALSPFCLQNFTKLQQPKQYDTIKYEYLSIEQNRKPSYKLIIQSNYFQQRCQKVIEQSANVVRKTRQHL